MAFWPRSRARTAAKATDDAEGRTGASAGAAYDPAAEAPTRGHYQDKLRPVLGERLALIDAAIPHDARSLLDVGCNLGDITAHYARRGLWSVGVDSRVDLIQEGVARQEFAPGCALMVSELTPENVTDLPRFDVVLLLSVHHHWYGQHGPDVAGLMLRDVMGRARQLVVFETSSRTGRFKPFSPDFVDNDDESVTAFHEDYLRKHVGDLAEVRRLGKAPCVGKREPFRWVWALRPVG